MLRQINMGRHEIYLFIHHTYTEGLCAIKCQLCCHGHTKVGIIFYQWEVFIVFRKVNEK